MQRLSISRFLNLEGGFAHAPNGTNFGCAFDGVSSCGRRGAFAAQAFASFCLTFLSQNHHKFIHGTGATEVLANMMFSQCGSKSVNTCATPESEGGAATGCFAVVQPGTGKKTAILHGAVIGDAAVIVIKPAFGLARLLSPTCRTDLCDPGGIITMEQGIDGFVWSFSEPVDKKDIILLVTDGFTDNINSKEFSQMIPHIMCSNIFDKVPVDTCVCVTTAPVHLPCLRHLRRIATISRFVPSSRPNSAGVGGGANC